MKARPKIIESKESEKSIVNFCGAKKIVGRTKKAIKRKIPLAAKAIKAFG